MAPKRYADGITNVASDKTMGQLIVPDPTSVIMIMEDFLKYDPNDWVITQTDSGGTEPSQILADESGGVLAITNTSVDDDNTFYQWRGGDNSETATETFTIASTKKLWFKARLKSDDVDANDIYIGLQDADTTPLAPANRVVWKSDDGDASLDFEIYASSAVALADTALATITDNTYFTVGFYWDGVDTMKYFYNDAEVGETTVTMPSTEMALSFGIQNGDSSASVLSIDYVCCIKER